MMQLRYELAEIQSVLRYLVLSEIALFVLAIIAMISFPVPPEITAAVEVMDELAESTTQGEGVYLFVGLCAFIVIAVLLPWSWWQLYHLDRRGLTKYIWGLGLITLSMPFMGGGWETGPIAFWDSLASLAQGAILCIGFLCPEVFIKPAAEMVPEAEPTEDEDKKTGAGQSD